MNFAVWVFSADECLVGAVAYVGLLNCWYCKFPMRNFDSV